jgi:molybdate transport system substrate-binding protein
LTRVALLFGGVALLLAACGGADGRTTVQVAAASNLQIAFEELRPVMERECGCDVVFAFGSSSLLREQVAAGAEFAVFFSADHAFVDALVEEGAVLPDSVVEYAHGRIVLVTREGIPPVSAVADLTREDLSRIAIANPRTAPYGRVAQQALEAAGVWEAIASHIVYGENIRQATDYVLSGNADAGIVALSLLANTGAEYVEVPLDLYAPIPQSAGVVRGVHETAAHAILDVVTGEEGRAVLARHGFGVEP